MDTIAINANEALGENGQDKKKLNLSDNAKAAVASGAAGLAAGAAAKAVADALGREQGEDVEATSDEQTSSQTVQPEEPVMESVATENVVAEVNPEEVMLEEPVAEPSTETDMIAESVTQPEVEDEYRPFANNDHISEEVLPEPQPEEVLIAESTEIEAAPESDSAVDQICGLPEQEEVTPEDAVYPEEDLYADNGPANNEYDVQSDLMA